MFEQFALPVHHTLNIQAKWMPSLSMIIFDLLLQRNDINRQ